MKNVDMSIKGDIVTITLDLSKGLVTTSIGKSIIIASSEGNISL